MKRVMDPLLLLISAQVMAETKVEETRFVATEQATRFVINLTKSPSYKVFTLDNPPRVVIDLQDTSLTSGLPKVRWKNNPVRRIRSGVRHDHDLRLVLDMKNMVRVKSYITTPSGNHGFRLIIELQQPSAVSTNAHATALSTKPAHAPTSAIPPIDVLAGWMDGRDAPVYGQEGL